MTRVLICGVSTRAAAASAARAGFLVTAIDRYSDLDQHPDVRALSVARDFNARFSAAAVARASAAIDADAVVYLSDFENHPRTLGALARRRQLWGNSPDVLRRVRDPLVLAVTLNERGFAVPAVRALPSGNLKVTGYPTRAGRAARSRPGVRLQPHDWLIKPLRSGGGRGVRSWNGREGLPRGSYLQRRVDGACGSIVFVAANGSAVPLGISQQIVGDPAFGASEYRYCGSVLLTDAAPQLRSIASALAATVAANFHLTGVNGIDFIVRDGVPLPIEVNPRWSASMELVERAYGISVFGAHASACACAALPAFDLAAAAGNGTTHGKAVVFARSRVTIGDTRKWLEDDNLHDVPHAGDRMSPGDPVCTVFATAAGVEACCTALRIKAAAIYARLEAWRREAA
jgi:predicted ATP-grasp superfamily ATP-dependent carboligase